MLVPACVSIPDPHSTETLAEFIAHFNHTQRMNWQRYQADRPIIYILFAYPSDRITSTISSSIFFHLLQGWLGRQCSPGSAFRLQTWVLPSGLRETCQGRRDEGHWRVRGFSSSCHRMQHNHSQSFPVSSQPVPCARPCGWGSSAGLHCPPLQVSQSTACSRGHTFTFFCF